MDIIFFLILATLVIGFIVYSLLSYHKTKSDPMPQLIVESYTVTAFDIEVSRIINEHRINLNLAALPMLDVLCDVAATHSRYMAEHQEESHDFATSRQNHFAPNNLGEIVGGGYEQPKSIFTAWVKSPGHYEKIKSNQFKNIGVATAVGSDRKKYVTVLFLG